MRVINYCLEIGAPLAAEVLHGATARCRCRRCQLDVLTLALNRFPPLYGVDWDGRTNLPPERRALLGLEVERAMTAAARVVAAAPGH